MRAHFVDTLLARLDGEIAPIWITIGLEVEHFPSPKPLCASFLALVRQIPRLNQRWNPSQSRWEPLQRSDEEVRAAFRTLDTPISPHALTLKAIQSPVDLSKDLPWRFWSAPSLHKGRATLLIQIHHAIGDARALGNLLVDLWNFHHDGTKPRTQRTPEPLLSDTEVLREVFRQPRALLGLFSSRNSAIARRATALKRSGDNPGDPWFVSASIPLRQTPSKILSQVLSATAKACANRARDPEGKIRFRVPVDLSQEMRWNGLLANTCITVPLEIPCAKARVPIETLAKHYENQLQSILYRKIHWSSALECLLLARLVPTKTLRKGARPGLLAHPRTNTLVTTYVGDLTPYFARAPFTIRRAWSHTPTWGINAWILQGRLHLTTTCFQGIWTPQEARNFLQDTLEHLHPLLDTQDAEFFHA